MKRMANLITWVQVSVLLLALCCGTTTADIIYVKAGGTGSGTSWADGYGDLQDGLNDASSGDEIWVAAGTYKPTKKVGGSSDKYKSFQMKNGIGIYGGFPDTGDPDMFDRDPNRHETILSGDLLGNDNPNTPVEDLYNDPSRADNCYHVVTGSKVGQSAIINGFTITGGHANGPDLEEIGGGMYNYGSDAGVSNCTFIRNSAFQGGGVSNLGSNPSFSECVFTQNFAKNAGGMYIGDQSNPTITDGTFISNTAEWSGGGVNCGDTSGSATLNNCMFNGNSARSGGGLDLSFGNFILTNCRIEGNKADYGGGMILTAGLASINSCTFSNNSSIEHGGGIDINNSDSIITACIFVENFSRQGAGVYSSQYSNPILNNCTFIGNDADYHGGGMFNKYYSNPTITNCTFGDNSAEVLGGGMYNADSNPTVTNCILWGNTAPNGLQIYNWASSPTVTYSDVQDGYPGTGNIDVDPLFVEPNGPDGIIGTEDDNLRLLGGSTCIDSGDNSVVTTAIDLDGNPRIVNGTVDMGAYEFFNTPPVANAGADQVVYAWIDGIAQVVLDGSGSFDADGDGLEYFWFIGDKQIASGVDPNVQLSVGEHIIELIVNDGSEDSEPNDVLVTVVPAVEAEMKFTPQALNPGSQGKWVKAHFVLAEAFAVEDVDANTPAEIEQLGIESEYMNVFINEDGLVEIEAAFSRSDFCGGVDYGPAEVTVTSRLIDGRYIYGTDTIRIIDKSLEYVADLASYWLEADCGPPDWCDGFDLDHNGVVNFVDFALTDGCCIEVIEE